MYFKPNLDNNGRISCARVRPISSAYSLRLAGIKLKKVDKVKFLRVMI